MDDEARAALRQAYDDADAEVRLEFPRYNIEKTIDAALRSLEDAGYCIVKLEKVAHVIEAFDVPQFHYPDPDCDQEGCRHVFAVTSQVEAL